MKFTCTKCGYRNDVPAKNQIAGGKARWRKMTKKQRTEAAIKMNAARWEKIRKLKRMMREVAQWPK